MKKLFLTLLLTSTFFTITAQDRFEIESQRTSKKHGERKFRNMFHSDDFGVLLGVNTYDQALDMPEQNIWQSRFVALQFRNNHRLITGRHVDVAIGSGLEFAWNNFMMLHDEAFYKEGDIADFELLDAPVDKSKLVVNHLNLPLMLQFGFKESKYIVAMGGYGGMRINSYQRLRYPNDKDFKDKGDYNLRRFNYGLMGELGKGDFRFFARYDINSMFNDNNPINANVLTVGVRL